MPGKFNDVHERAMKRFELARSAWAEAREAWAEDARYVNVESGQWDKAVKDRRESKGKPALEFNELHTYVQQIVNRARQNRPQPRVSAGDDEAAQETAEFLEGRLRHIWYASQADVAQDTAVEASATGGFGFYEITTEYTDDGARGGKPSWNQEPRIKRILDPLTEYPDPHALEPDFSDAKFWFSRKWFDRDVFKQEFGVEPVEFDAGADPEWSKEDQVCAAQYWEVTETPRRYLRLIDGSEGFEDELTFPEGVEPDALIEAEREVKERQVCCYLIDGEKVLEKTEWLGNWIPRIAVLGREVVVDGKRHFISAVRFARDAQKLKNAYKSNIANLLQISSTAPWIGPKGSFKDKRWATANTENFATLEYEIVSLPNGMPAPPPQRNTYEAPIQALTMAAVQVSDDIKRAVGYAGAILQPSKADLSGVAVERRDQQVDLTNFHYQDNLVRSQWHCARVVLDLDMKLADTPRVMRARREDGSTYTAPVTMADETGVAPAVPGYESKPHHRFDVGRYDIVIQTGKSYDRKLDEERDILLQIAQANPAAWSVYGDLIFKALGYQDLEERAPGARAADPAGHPAEGFRNSAASAGATDRIAAAEPSPRDEAAPGAARAKGQADRGQDTDRSGDDQGAQGYRRNGHAAQARRRYRAVRCADASHRQDAFDAARIRARSGTSGRWPG